MVVPHPGRDAFPTRPANEMRIGTRNAPTFTEHSPGLFGKRSLPLGSRATEITKIFPELMGFLRDPSGSADWRTADPHFNRDT
jgi:hypothetical protein